MSSQHFIRVIVILTFPLIVGSQQCIRLLSISLKNLSVSSKAANSSQAAAAKSTNNNNGNFNTFLAPVSHQIVKEIEIGGPLWRRKEITELPLTNKIIESPLQITKVIEEIQRISNDLNLPTSQTTNSEKQAKNGMIQIRKRKMRVHKRKKLFKKMRYLWKKVRQRREIKKEKRFRHQIELKMNEARNFSAEQFVEERLKLASEPPLCRKWKGRRLPAFIIHELNQEAAEKKIKQKFERWEQLGKQNGLF